MTTELPTRRPRRQAEPTPARQLREAIAPYIALPRLRRLLAEHGDLSQALRCPTPPQAAACISLAGCRHAAGTTLTPVRCDCALKSSPAR